MVHGVAFVMPKEIYFFLAAMILIALAIAVARALAGDMPAVRSKPLLTERERAALVLIERVLPNARIYVQVSMGALLQPARGTRQRDYLSVRNRFSQKIVDYVVEDRASGTILALIELDDRSHNSARDIIRDRMTSSAGYRTIRIPSGRLTQADIALRLQPLLLSPSALRTTA